MKVYRIAEDKFIMPLNGYMKGVNHRGFNTAPENTIPAYVLSAKMGFKFVECDVSFTRDSVPVLLHDSTIDRTSNGSGRITEMTFDEVRQYDFGSWKSSAYTGIKIPSLEEFLVTCRNLGLHPYIEIKSSASYTDSQIQMIVDLVKMYGLSNKVTYISFSSAFLAKVKDYDESARIGFVVSSVTDSSINTAKSLLTGKNEVFIDASYSSSTIANAIALCKLNKLPLEIWTVDNKTTISNLDGYVSGVTSNNQNAEFIKFENSWT